MNYTCPTCGYLVFSQEPGSGEICPICGWEDDARQLKYPQTGGANKVSLIQAQKNYSIIGASDKAMLSNVRKITDKDKKDREWRVFDTQIDKLEILPEGKNYLESYPSDNVVYYWTIN